MTETFFDQIVFWGGGTRCIWQGGFMDVLCREIPLNPARVTGVSGGACSACGFVTHRGRRIRDTFIEKFDQHDRNIPLHEPFDGKSGTSPHQAICREIIQDCFGDKGAHDRIASNPQMQILIGRPPAPTGPRSRAPR